MILRFDGGTPPQFMGEILVTKLNSTTAGNPEEGGPFSFFSPMQEGFERCRLASEHLTSACSEIAAHEFTILENAFFGSLGEMQGLSPVHGPVEFFEQSAILTWRNAERSVKAFSELGDEICRFWFDTIKAVSSAAPRQTKSRSAQ